MNFQQQPSKESYSWETQFPHFANVLGDLSLLLHFKRVELQTCVGARRNPEGRTKGGKVEWAWLFIPAYHIWEEVLTFLPHQGVLPPRPGSVATGQYMGRVPKLQVAAPQTFPGFRLDGEET